MALFSIKGFSSDVVEISEYWDNHMFLYEELEYLVDENYSISEVSGDELSKKFIPNKLFAPHNFNNKKAYWIRIRIRGNPASDKKWILEFYDQTTDIIEAFMPDGKGGFIKKVSGDSLLFKERRFKHKNFEFDIENKTDKVEDYYFKIRSFNNVNILIVLRSLDYFIYYALNEYFLYGLFYGMILAIIVYNFLMYLAIKESPYIFYVVYLFSVGIYFMCLDGIAYQYLWPNAPQWNQIAYGVALFSLVVCSLLFTKAFLHTKSKFPILNRIINATIIIRAIIFLIVLCFFPKLFAHRWIDLFPISITFLSGLYAFIKGYKPARFFVTAYFLLLLGFLVRILLNLDLNFFPSSIFIHYSINMSFLGEMLFLTFALGDKVRILKNTRDKALKKIIAQHKINEKLKDKVNKELESEVSKRTKEIQDQKIIIEEAHERLRQQAEEIKKINSILDKDNFKLQDRVKEKMLERATHKSMDYNDFRIIFPNELSCLRYLEKEKWEKGFACKKCKNDKHTQGKGKFDRRCTRCGYNESPTAYTIFHGIKFSLEKAFYILHLIITERDDLSLEEVSKILDLRKNTCGSFKRKVILTIKKNKWDKSHLENWQNVIFYSNEVEKEDLKA